MKFSEGRIIYSSTPWWTERCRIYNI